MKQISFAFRACSFLVVCLLQSPGFSAEKKQLSTRFWMFDVDRWQLDGVSDEAGRISGVNVGGEFEWPSINQRGGLAYPGNPNLVRNWELEHPVIRDWRLNTNSVRLFGGAASGQDLRRSDSSSGREFFEIDNSTRFFGAEARLWLLDTLSIELGVIGSSDSFNAREETFVHERFYNDLDGTVEWGVGQLVLTPDGVFVGPLDQSGVFTEPSTISSSTYLLSGIDTVDVRIPNARNIAVDVIDAGVVDVDFSNGDSVSLAVRRAGRVVFDVSNAADAEVIASEVETFEAGISNGTDVRVVGVHAGDVSVRVTNASDFRLLLSDSGTASISLPNARDSEIEVFRSGSVSLDVPESVSVAVEQSGAVTNTTAETTVDDMVSSDFQNEVDEALEELPTEARQGALVMVSLPGCSLLVERSDQKIQLKSTSLATLEECVEQLVTSSDDDGFEVAETSEVALFRDNSGSLSGKARLGYRGEGFFLGRFYSRAVESVSGGLTFESSPQGNGIGRSGSWVDAKYRLGLQLHANPQKDERTPRKSSGLSARLRNPFPRFMELNARYVREITEFQTSWTELGASLHGSFGLRRAESDATVRHYTFGYSRLRFRKSRDDSNPLDFRLDHTQQGFGVAFLSFDLLDVRKSVIRFSYTGSRVEFEGLRSDWQHRVGLSWRGSF